MYNDKVLMLRVQSSLVTNCLVYVSTELVIANLLYTCTELVNSVWFLLVKDFDYLF